MEQLLGGMVQTLCDLARGPPNSTSHDAFNSMSSGNCPPRASFSEQPSPGTSDPHFTRHGASNSTSGKRQSQASFSKQQHHHSTHHDSSPGTTLYIDSDDGIDPEPKSKTKSSQNVLTVSEEEAILEKLDDVKILDENDDFGEVMGYLRCAAADWRTVGQNLHVRASKIEEIDISNGRFPAMCMDLVVAEWLKLNYNLQQYGMPTWRKVAESVVKVNKKVFLSIASKHTVQVKQTAHSRKREMSFDHDAGSPSSSVPPSKKFNLDQSPESQHKIHSTAAVHQLPSSNRTHQRCQGDGNRLQPSVLESIGKPVGRPVKHAAKDVTHMFVRRGHHNFAPNKLSSGIVIACNYCGWKKGECKDKKNCTGNPDGPYAKRSHSRNDLDPKQS